MQPHSGTPQNTAARGARTTPTHTHKRHQITHAAWLAAWRRQCHLHPSIGTLSCTRSHRLGDPRGNRAGDGRAGGIESNGTQLGGWVFGSKENHLASQIDRHIDSTTAGLGYLVYKGAHDRLARGALAAFPARRGVENAGEADRAFRQFRRKNYVRPCHTTHR